MRCCVLVTLCVLVLTHEAAGLNLMGLLKKHQEQAPQQQQATHGEITSLPGYKGPLPSKHFGGYVSVGSRQLYYYLVESERSPTTDPVV
jgi:carboxypeptidase C (cathepsin A)